MKNVVLVGWSQGVQDVAAYVEQFGTDSIAGFVLVDSPLSSGPAEIKLHPESSEYYSKPTLVVASAESNELESQREMQRSIPNAQLEAVSEAGHAVFIDQPKKFKPDENGRPKNPGAINGGFYKKSADMPAQYPSVVIGVGNIKETMKKVTEAGGQVLGEPMEIPGYGVYVSFFDTEGNRVSMMQPK